MTIEELKLVLDTVNAVSGDAKIVAVTWLILSFFGKLLGWFSFTYVLVFVCKAFMTSSRAHYAVLMINETLKHPGTYNPVSVAEYNRIVNAVRDLQSRSDK